jgi:hypothetical protein
MFGCSSCLGRVTIIEINVRRRFGEIRVRIVSLPAGVRDDERDVGSAQANVSQRSGVDGIELVGGALAPGARP